jgi:hypothetical protein
MTGPRLTESALWYATKYSWSVFPLRPKSKEPYGETHGFLDASTDRERIRAWWREWPESNVGIACEPSGLVVVDVDPKHDGPASWEALRAEYGALKTVEAITPSGGSHYYLSRNGIAIPSGQNVLGRGIDIRAAGGYVVAPPSFYADAAYQGPYCWEESSKPNVVPVLPCPEWLSRLATAKKITEFAPSVTIIEGARNGTLTQYAGAMRRRGIEPDAIFAALRVMNEKRCRPPLPEGELRKIAQSVGRYTPGAPLERTPSHLVTKHLSEYTPESVVWLWSNRVPVGKVSVLAGDAGEGKSFATLGLAGCLTTGRPLPGGSDHELHSVLIWNGEDAPEDTLHQRARLAGADLERIIILEEVTEGEVRVPFGLKHVPDLDRELELHPEITLVVIDPITALLSVDVVREAHSDSHIRAALQPLAELARKHRVAVLLVMHLKKGDELNALHRLCGSVAFGALARSVMFLGTHALSGRKGIDCIKHNLAPTHPEPVEFSLTEEDGFQWIGIASDLTAQTIRASQVRANRGARGASAEDFLRELLRGGPKDSRDVFTEAHDRGIADVTLKRAKEKLGVKARKIGIGEGSRWSWELPETSEEDHRDEPLRRSSEDAHRESREPSKNPIDTVRTESMSKIEEYQRSFLCAREDAQALDSWLENEVPE